MANRRTVSVIRCGTRKAEPVIVGNAVIVYRYVVQNGCGVVNPTPGKCWNCGREIVAERTEVTIQSIQKDLDDHYRQNPTHGVGCACVKLLEKDMRKLLSSEHMGTDTGKASFWLLVNSAINWR